MSNPGLMAIERPFVNGILELHFTRTPVLVNEQKPTLSDFPKLQCTSRYVERRPKNCTDEDREVVGADIPPGERGRAKAPLGKRGKGP